jgi:hypothetical protein
VSLPAWLATTAHEPLPLSSSMSPLIAQTSGVVVENVTGSPVLA